MTLVEPGDNSNYNALQVNLERRFSRGLTILANYTFSKSIDTSSFNKQTGQTVTDPYNRGLDRGVSDFNHPHIFNFSALWNLPVKPANPFAKAVLGGWQLSGIVSLQSGEPFSVYSNVDNARSGTSNQRADMIGNPYLSGDRSRGAEVAEWLNPAAFTVNALGTFGNSGRNRFIGPGYASTDLALEKEFRPIEQLGIQFRAEAFNAFNRPNLMNPDHGVGDANFMAITSAFDPRILQFAIRLKW
jgi:hypothetical protein